MNKNVVFGIGGLVVGTGIGFVVGKITYKKKLDKAERDIEILLKEINRPEKDSEVGDEDTNKEEEKPEAAGEVSAAVNEEGQRKLYSGERSESKKEVDYEAFYAKGYKASYKVDPAEMEHPEDDEQDEPIDGPEDVKGGDPGFWETEEERAFLLEEELKASGELIDETNENYYAGLEMTNEMNSGKKPRLISAESYWDEYPHHAKANLEYYTESDILVDLETEEEIDDEELMVGNCLDKYDYRNDDMCTIIYVRNFSFGIDYCISKVFGAWEPV